MRIEYLTIGEELSQKDYLTMDLIFVYKAPSDNGALKIELSKYEGGLANQKFATLHIEQGQFIDMQRIKAGENPDGLDTKDYIVRKITAAKKPINTLSINMSGAGFTLGRRVLISDPKKSMQIGTGGANSSSCSVEKESQSQTARSNGNILSLFQKI